MKMTVTEALAEIKTIAKRLEKKRAFVLSFLWRQEKLKDPLAKDGGSPEAIKKEMQGIGDLENRVVSIRRAIQHANDTTSITLEGGAQRTISELLTWRREVAPGQKKLLEDIRTAIDAVRRDATKKGLQVTATAQEAKPDDVVINVNESALAKDIEQMEIWLGHLDGQLSLKNATTMIELPD
jgi:hypothetical protein